jgi:integrase/recombinase XerD
MRAQVDDFLHHIAIEKGYSRHTVAAYRNDLRQFTDHLRKRGIKSWQALGRSDVLGYILDLKDREYAKSTIARKVASVKSFFHFLLTDGIVTDDPTATVDSPPIGRHLPRPLSVDEVGRLLAEPAKSTTPRALRDSALLELMYATGMRASEIIQLDVDAIDLGDGTVRCMGKGSKERILPLYRRAEHALAAYLDDARSHLARDDGERALFLNHRGGALTRQGLWLIVKEYAKAAGIEAVTTPHVLRHSYATHMLDGGAGLREVQQLLGHANISSTQIYTKVSTRRQRKVYDEAHPRA